MNQPEGEAFTMPTCGHQFCRDCFAAYAEHKIGSGEVDGQRLKCPHVNDEHLQAADGWACRECTFFNAAAGGAEAGEVVTCEICQTEQPRPPPAEPGCAVPLELSTLRALELDDAVIARYQRFVAIQADSTSRRTASSAATNSSRR